MLLGVYLFLVNLAFAGPENPRCSQIHFSDVGWTDISANTALASVLLKSLGYQTRVSQLSVPVTYMSLKNQDIDVFLGNWMPTMAADIRPYQEDKSVETIGVLLKDAHYTLAVPRYVYDAGVRTISDLEKHRDQFRGRIYGIESGNDGNRLIQKMISDGKVGLKDWKLIESSEQAMLMELFRSIKRKNWIVFLGWEPHPMNSKAEIRYLNGADEYFGKNKGSSTVFINTRRNYSKECPQVAKFLKNFTLSMDIESELMEMILSHKISPEAAAQKWLSKGGGAAKIWLSHVLKGIKTLDGKDAHQAIQKFQTNTPLIGRNP